MSTFLSILPIIIALVLYFTGIPIAYALFAAALTYFGFIDTATVPYLLMQKFVTATQSFPFLAIPFFIMCGSIMNYGGISARLMDFADALTGHLPGGLAQINHAGFPRFHGRMDTGSMPGKEEMHVILLCSTLLSSAN